MPGRALAGSCGKNVFRFEKKLPRCPPDRLPCCLPDGLPRCPPDRLRRSAVNDSPLAPPPRQHSVLLGFPDLDHINRRAVVSPRGFHLQFPDAESFSYCFLIMPTGFREEREELIGRW